MNYTTPEILAFLKPKFDYYKEEKAEVWKIKINGDFFKTIKGKSSWGREHHARSAFLNFIEGDCRLYFVHQKFREQDPTKNHWQNNSTAEENKDFIKQLEDAGVVEFVRVV